MAAPFNLASNAKAHDPGVRKHFVDVYTKADPMVEKILKTEKQTDYSEERQNYTGIADLEQINEGQRYPEDAPIQAYQTVFTSVKYGKVVSLTMEAEFWDKSGAGSPKSIVEMESKAVARSVGRRGAALFNDAFTASATSLSDNKPLASISHPRADGGASQSNASGTSIALTEANVEVGKLALEQVLDDRGQEIEFFANNLLVPFAKRKKALEIIKSELRSGTADNDINTYNPKGAVQAFKGATIDEVIAWRYLTSTTAWHLLSDDHMVCWLWGEKPLIGEVDTSSGNLSDIAYWKVRYQSSTGWQDWRGTWHSQGDDSTYAG